MLIFGVDVRRRICRQHETWMQYIDIKSHLDNLRSDSDETNPEILNKLEMAYNIMKEIDSIKRQDMTDEIKRFEEDFVKEVKENKFLYGD